MPSEEQRRERVRLAQERSRARRRADHARLVEQVGNLSNAIEDMTGIFLEFSNAMLAETASNEQNAQRAPQISEYMRRFLAIARPAMESTASYEDSTQDSEQDLSTEASAAGPSGQSGGLSENTSDNTSRRPRPLDLDAGAATGESSTGAQRNPRSSESPGPFSPRMNYGLWINFNQSLMPRGILQWVEGATSRLTSFATRLWWNAIHLEHDVLISKAPEATLLASHIFAHALPFERREYIAARLYTRLAYTPSSVPILIRPSPSAIMDSSSYAGSDGDVDLDTENAWRSRHIDMVKLSMAMVREPQSDYLDSHEVQSRLAEVWGVDMDELSSEMQNSSDTESQRIRELDLEQEIATVRNIVSSFPRLDNSNVPRPIASQTPASSFSFMSPPTRGEAITNLCHDLILKLALTARCTGKGICFPVKAVDEVAQNLLARRPNKICMIESNFP